MTEFIVAPLVGSVIGYITNALAIRMLFRPHQPKYLWGHQLPFTPGIIPKEKGRIAASVGVSISKNLMNEEVMEKNLLSENLLSKLDHTVERYFDKQKNNSETLRSYLGHILSDEDINQISSKCGNDLKELLYVKLASSSVGDRIAHVAITHVMEKMQHFGSIPGHNEGIGDWLGKGIKKIFGQSGSDATSQFINSLAEPAERALANHINEILRNNSKEIVGDLISKEIDSLLSRRMSDLLADKEKEILQVRKSILSLYTTMIRERLPRILAAVDISKIVEERINEMDMNEAEEIIFDVMDKELKAIVWLGAGLGFIMGFINCLF
jgi:uncharacterized membrane protein YheB (UPF0754 family)